MKFSDSVFISERAMFSAGFSLRVKISLSPFVSLAKLIFTDKSLATVMARISAKFSISLFMLN
jgi:hypothetical protein